MPLSLSDEGAVALAAILPFAPFLRKLNLRRNSIGDAGATHFALALQSIRPRTVLQALDLGGNRVTDAGAVELAGAMGINRNLAQLILTSGAEDGPSTVAPIGTLGSAALRTAQARSPTLESVVFESDAS